jgi:hypothetical protein
MVYPPSMVKGAVTPDYSCRKCDTSRYPSYLEVPSPPLETGESNSTNKKQGIGTETV